MTDTAIATTQFEEFVLIEDETLMKKVIKLLARGKFNYTTNPDKPGRFYFSDKEEYNTMHTFIREEFRGQYNILNHIHFSYE